ncbi:MAG: hypothetical protein L3J31_00420 [Bacteroidales bacterium]|nr:hypothetical protein [Bacteroidales bacterium]MCF6341254.1 hypothetical protein [Bacteroidales bacterium]
MMWLKLLIITVWVATLLVAAMGLQLIKEVKVVKATPKYFGGNRRNAAEKKNQ